jgi:hypothetical protein
MKLTSALVLSFIASVQAGTTGVIDSSYVTFSLCIFPFKAKYSYKRRIDQWKTALPSLLPATRLTLVHTMPRSPLSSHPSALPLLAYLLP